MRLRPKRPPSHAVSGMVMTQATMYPVETQVISSTLADNVPRNCGSATFTIEVSIVPISVPNVTAAAMSHLFFG